MTTLFSASDLQNIVVIAITFILGILAKSRIPWGKNNSEVLDVVTKDFQTLKILYDSKVEDLKKRDEQLANATADLLQAKARITSYENFLQSRTLETDELLRKLAIKFDIETGMNGHQSAHSQAK